MPQVDPPGNGPGGRAKSPRSTEANQPGRQVTIARLFADPADPCFCCGLLRFWAVCDSYITRRAQERILVGYTQIEHEAAEEWLAGLVWRERTQIFQKKADQNGALRNYYLWAFRQGVVAPLPLLAVDESCSLKGAVVKLGRSLHRLAGRIASGPCRQLTASPSGLRDGGADRSREKYSGTSDRQHLWRWPTIRQPFWREWSGHRLLD